MVLHVLARGTDEGNPKEGQAEEEQDDHGDQRAIAAIVIDPSPHRFRAAVRASDIHRPRSQITTSV